MAFNPKMIGPVAFEPAHVDLVSLAADGQRAVQDVVVRWMGTVDAGA